MVISQNLDLQKDFLKLCLISLLPSKELKLCYTEPTLIQKLATLGSLFKPWRSG